MNFDQLKISSRGIHKMKFFCDLFNSVLIKAQLKLFRNELFFYSVSWLEDREGRTMLA
jgi:hypothetical protein